MPGRAVFRAEDPGPDRRGAAHTHEPDERVATGVDELRRNGQHPQRTRRRIPDGGLLVRHPDLHPAHRRRAIDRLGGATAVLGWRIERAEGDLGRRGRGRNRSRSGRRGWAGRGAACERGRYRRRGRGNRTASRRPAGCAARGTHQGDDHDADDPDTLHADHRAPIRRTTSRGAWHASACRDGMIRRWPTPVVLNAADERGAPRGSA